MHTDLTNLVLCGGSGSRLWPLSRTHYPKQFIKLFNARSTFQLTLAGNATLCHKRLIVSNIAHQAQVKDQLLSLGLSQNDFVWETASRNTAAALTLATLRLAPDTLVLATPADHLIDYSERYFEAVHKACTHALNGHIVAFGISPTMPHTGYGYLEFQGHNVLRFHEKPELHIAKAYLKEGNFLWNSGIYCFTAGYFLEQMQKLAPEIFEATYLVFTEAQKHPHKLPPEELMEQIPQLSIDYALMEKLNTLKVIPAYFGWNDVGSFEAIAQTLVADSEGNTKKGRVFCLDSKNSLFLGDRRPVVAIGIEDLIVVDTPDALLVAKKGVSSKVKEMLPAVELEDEALCKEHSHQERPWGSFTVLEKDAGFKVKKLVVHPGKRLSLQWHRFRSEHWVVVSGRAIVTNGEKTLEMGPNESIYIPVGEQHRLENPGQVPLVLIEVQCGEYTGEDDIIRIEDDFQRTQEGVEQQLFSSLITLKSAS